MIVTIMSDASVCPHTSAGGWGIWIISNRGHFQGSGAYKKLTPDVAEAEAKALYNAVFLSFQYGLSQKGDKLILQIDNKFFIEACSGTFHGGNKHLKDFAKKFKKMIKDKECEYEIRYVQAHNPNKAGRNYVNEICDQLAKSAMRKQRKLLRAA
jgi:ribonuclease HI